ncbi:MAG: FAD:protein FMN transferase [Dehalococcoidia bacterium]|nr:FAD:protein FMN transferase [Dehalococcoidia bacterium]
MQLTDSFRAMDTAIDVFVEAAAPRFDLPLSIRLLFERQEARYSRFRAESLVSRLNAGEAVVDAELARVVGMALEAHAFTGGLFNPMVLPALRAAGYDRTFAEVAHGAPRAQPVLDPREAIEIEGERVRLRAGGLDLGGIVKGWTVDLAVELAVPEVEGVLVNAGGDLRAEGNEPGLDGWQVEVDRPGGGVAWGGVVRGAVATSTVLRRRWQTAAGPAHHLVDPRTGLPAESGIAQATAWAPLTWVAECWAKAVVVGGAEAAELARAAGVAVLGLDAEAGVVVDTMTP